MKNFFVKIWGYLIQFWNWLRWVTRKPLKRQYVVQECLAMPSLVGMKCYGKPVVNQPKMFTGGKEVGHRQITPALVDRRKGGDLDVYTKYLYLVAKRTY